MSDSYHAPLHWFARIMVGGTLLLIAAGGLVTSHDAGLSVPDWPLSYGSLMPEMVGGILYEHTHRLVAASIGFLTIVFNLLLARWERRRWVRRLGWLALLAVCVQGLLGGLTVLLHLPTPVSVLHACLAQIYFCLIVSLAVVTSRSWLSPAGPPGDPRLLRVALLATGSVFLQLIFGAILRHAGTVGGTKGALLVTPALVLHLAGALLVVLCLVWLLLRMGRQGRPFPRLAALLAVLLGGQLGLGVMALLARLQRLQAPQPVPRDALLTTAHVVVGAVLLGSLLVLVLHLGRWRQERRPSNVVASGAVRVFSS